MAAGRRRSRSGSHVCTCGGLSWRAGGAQTAGGRGWLAHLVPSSWGLGRGWGNCILSKSQVTLMLLVGAPPWEPLGHCVMALVTPAIRGWVTGTQLSCAEALSILGPQSPEVGEHGEVALPGSAICRCTLLWQAHSGVRVSPPPFPPAWQQSPPGL